MDTTVLRYNFDEIKRIPTDLYNRIWAESDRNPDSFWTSSVLRELEEYLGQDVIEINKLE